MFNISKRMMLVAVLGIGVAGSGAGPALALTLKEVANATTATELTALGAKVLTAGQFKKRVIGRKMTEIKGSWDWIINADGTSLSGGQSSSWKMKGNLYCRGYEKGEENCSQAFLIGDYLRMTKSGSNDLAGWTVKLD
ncbi:MAG: hypothetical protein B7Z02_00005 [Rhodobacterales bacterium 32-67-9]|nr:MAG: hypothetical protein B7Z02_00005 [Rhodobacterales bacterium 32-67-9]